MYSQNGFFIYQVTLKAINSRSHILKWKQTYFTTAGIMTLRTKDLTRNRKGYAQRGNLQKFVWLSLAIPVEGWFQVLKSLARWGSLLVLFPCHRLDLPFLIRLQKQDIEYMHEDLINTQIDIFMLFLSYTIVLLVIWICRKVEERGYWIIPELQMAMHANPITLMYSSEG